MASARILGAAAAIGRKERIETNDDVTLFVAFWITKDDVSRGVSRRLQEAGYSPTEPGCLAFLVFQQQMERRSFEAKGRPSEIWYLDLAREAGVQGETPRSLDALLRTRALACFSSVCTGRSEMTRKCLSIFACSSHLAAFPTSWAEHGLGAHLPASSRSGQSNGERN